MLNSRAPNKSVLKVILAEDDNFIAMSFTSQVKKINEGKKYALKNKNGFLTKMSTYVTDSGL